VHALIAWTLSGAALVAVAALVLSVVRMRRVTAAARSRAELAERTSAVGEQRRRAALEHLPVIALRVDATGRLLEANRAALERFPFLTPSLSVLEAFSEHELASRVGSALARLEPDELEVRLFAGGRRTYRAAVAPYVVDGDREALLFLTDASAAVDYQELRSQFVANVSHELRTPLTGLRGLLEALVDPEMDEHTRAAFLRRAASETARLEALILDILFLSELETTPGLPSSEVSDLAAAVRATVEELADDAAEYGVTLRAEARGLALTPLTDRMARTVARNLIENAVKYAGPGATARAAVRVAGGSVELVVSDDGLGIPERHLPHVFERFYRADPSRSKRLGGTGLGLSIVKHIAERFGGRAEATSREGFGTTVRVTLPAAPGGALPPLETPALGGERGPR
jgi:two-component system phosphate regulon sensor histidine kinase PhoR